MRDLTKWHRRFLELAAQVSTWSKDPSKQVGCVIARDNKFLALGYNGFPADVEDDPELYNNKELKRKIVVHAEHNAIKNFDVDFTGATAYVTYFPCIDCAEKLIAEGITRVVSPALPEGSGDVYGWSHSQKRFEEEGIEVLFMELYNLHDVEFMIR